MLLSSRTQTRFLEADPLIQERGESPGTKNPREETLKAGCLTWSDHDLILLGAHPQEGQVVLGVDVPDGGSGLQQQLVDQSGILDGTGAVQSGFDGNS